VIGLNTAIASSSGGSEGIAFAIPANLAMYIAGQLIDRGSVSRAFLGVQLDSRFGPEAATRLGLAQPKGARVTGTTPQSPAEAAKLVVDDVVLEFNGTQVDDDSHLVNLVSHTPIGTEAAILVFRAGKTITLRVKVGDRSQFDPRP
jgi:serine protease Do